MVTIAYRSNTWGIRFSARDGRGWSVRALRPHRPARTKSTAARADLGAG
jgi:hypothetical protein